MSDNWIVKNIERALEVKINKEIRGYSEVMFFGLTLRQTVFSALAVGVAVLLYFLLRERFGLETVSWVCVLGAAPFAALGFVSYHGMTAEKLAWAWLRSELLEPKQYACKPQNLYYELLKDSLSNKQKEARKRNAEKRKKDDSGE